MDFRVTPHERKKDVQIVEVLVGGEVVAVIYPDGEKGMKIVSAHFTGTGTKHGIKPHVEIDEGSDPRVPIPAVLLSFNPQPYEIRGGKIVKLPPKK